MLFQHGILECGFYIMLIIFKLSELKILRLGTTHKYLVHYLFLENQPFHSD